MLRDPGHVDVVGVVACAMLLAFWPFGICVVLVVAVVVVSVCVCACVSYYGFVVVAVVDVWCFLCCW
jgi:hypothetical protein